MLSPSIEGWYTVLLDAIPFIERGAASVHEEHVPPRLAPLLVFAKEWYGVHGQNGRLGGAPSPATILSGLMIGLRPSFAPCV